VPDQTFGEVFDCVADWTSQHAYVVVEPIDCATASLGGFLAGEGGPLSRWAEPVGLNGSTGGSGIRPLDADEARSFLERFGSAEDVEQYFATEIEDA
jgi:hypothetical protein